MEPQIPKTYRFVWPVVIGCMILLIAGMGVLAYQSKAHKTDNGYSSSLNPYDNLQAKARDTKRQTDINTLQVQLEAYYSTNGYYPSFADFSSATWRDKNMPALDSQATVDPSDTSNIGLVSDARPKAYAYQPTNAAGKSCESDATTCAQYTLTATLETSTNGVTVYVKKSLD